MHMGHRTASDSRQQLPVKRFVKVIPDVALHHRDAFLMALKVHCVRQHRAIIASQNARSLFQVYHLMK
jgi:hypothetical protein